MKKIGQRASQAVSYDSGMGEGARVSNDIRGGKTDGCAKRHDQSQIERACPGWVSQAARQRAGLLVCACLKELCKRWDANSHQSSIISPTSCSAAAKLSSAAASTSRFVSFPKDNCASASIAFSGLCPCLNSPKTNIGFTNPSVAFGLSSAIAAACDPIYPVAVISPVSSCTKAMTFQNRAGIWTPCTNGSSS